MESYSGTWERSGRSLNAAAAAGLLGIGIVYFYGGSFLTSLALILHGNPPRQTHESVGFFDALARSAELTKTPIRISMVVAQLVLMLAPTLWLVRHWHTQGVRSYIRLRPSPFPQVILAVASAVLFFPFNVYFSGLLTEMLNIPHQFVAISQRLFSASTGGEFLFVVLVVAVTPAICEEILFRGYAQRTFERSLGWKSIVLVGILFGLFHMQPLGLFSLSGLGLMFGFFFYFGKSLLPGMAAHFTNNFLVVLSLYLAAGGEAGPLGAGHMPLALVVISLPCAGVALYVFYRISLQASLNAT
jgi:membrane protease YdiL (CAAX protease family)